MPTVSRHVSASASGSASKRAPTAPGLGLQDSGGDLGGRGEPCGFAAALGQRWRAAHNSTGPTTAKRDTHLTRKRSGLHLCPISRSLTTSCVCLEPRPLPSTGITRLPRYCGPLRHPSAPGLSLTGVRLII